MIEQQAIIDRIREVNDSAERGWLGQFSAPQLAHYFDHLCHMLEPRGATSRWVRRGTLPAVLVHTPEE